MRRTPLRRYGLMLLAVVVTTLGMTTPAAHAADTGSISGTITYGGQPVAGVFVYADGGDTVPGVNAETNAAGEYQIPAVQPGRYRIMLVAEGHPDQFAPATPLWDAAALYQVTADGTTTVNATLMPFGTITGRLTNAAGQGMAEVYVYAQAHPQGDTTGWTLTDSSGNYNMPVAVGDVTVAFDVPGGSQYAHGTRDYLSADVFSVVAGQTLTVNDTFLQSGSVSGTVLAAAGQPAAGVEVIVTNTVGSGEARALTDAAGNYRIDELVPGQYEVSFTLQPTETRMWHPRTVDPAQAQPVTITGGGVLDLDQTLLATGTLAGRFTAADGTTPIPYATVDARTSGAFGVIGSTDDSGNFSISPVFVGGYQVNFSGTTEALEFWQWAPRTLVQAEATVFTVTAGGTTTVNESLLQTGSVLVDEVLEQGIGAGIGTFEADVAGRTGDTTTGTLELTGVPVGTHVLRVRADGFQETRATITVTVNSQTNVPAVYLRRQPAITGTVVDRASGLPVADVCLLALPASAPFRLTEDCTATSDAAGNYKVVPAVAGSYQLFAVPLPGSGHGAQWVGATGGTGDQRQAAVLTVTATTGTTGPAIKLDPYGTVTGLVTGANGAALPGAKVDVYAPHPAIGGGTGHVNADQTGRYTSKFLGPYQWPLLFTANGHAPQWSGGTADRFTATTVGVTAGGTTTYNYKMKAGVLVTGPIKLPNGSVGNGRLLATHPVTGDFMGFADTGTSGAYQLRVLGSVSLQLVFEGSAPYGAVPYEGGFSVSADKTINLCVLSPTVMQTCGGPLQRRPTTPEDRNPVPNRPPAPGGDGPGPRKP